MIVYFDSPIGSIHIECSEKGISKLVFADEMTSHGNTALTSYTSKGGSEMTSHVIPDFSAFTSKEAGEMTSQAISQLNEYFSHKRRIFDLPLDLQGTPFQLRVWNELLSIPYGKTISYKELALQLGDAKAIRAAGTANGANPVSIIVPCHRVIGSDGSLIGYGGGLWRKKWLLEHESSLLRLL
jgi:methylated-DNA-[protein]-cysteine S-methyltransferase